MAHTYRSLSGKWPHDESLVLRKSLFCRTIEILAVQNKACIILSYSRSKDFCFRWLLDGLSLSQRQAHPKVHAVTVI
uniref:hypothetical protein n=1 Tax=Paenibacillus harenae TaxID=306543 RepID=UPI0027D91928|nr:hypothetical protein [Paenibacillus harenae]